MEKIKIIRIIARLNIGGPAIHTVLLTASLDKNQFASWLVCGAVDKAEGDMSYYARERNVEPYFIPELTRRINPLKDLTAFFKLYNFICHIKPDIIHTHTAKAGGIGRAAGILYNLLHLSGNKKIKLVHTFHGHVFEGYFNKVATLVFVRIERFLARFTDIIITVSDSLKGELISLGIGEGDKVRVVPLGFELDRFLNIPFLDREPSHIGIVGRLVPIKNHRLFLDAAAKFLRQENFADVRFSIIGDGELRRELEDYARKLGIAGRVYFLGWRKDLVEVYSGLDVVCLTSLNEGTPVSLIEAMASGCPVVATDVGGVRDLLGEEQADLSRPGIFRVLERGIISAPTDSNGFSQALSLMLQNNKFREGAASAGREFVRNKFSKERLFRDIEAIYKMI